MPAHSNNRQSITFEISAVTVGFDVGAFDDALRDHGVQFVHYRAMKCPVGMRDEYSTRRPHEDHSGCSNGQIYTKAGLVTALFTSNSNRQDQNEVGLLDGATVRITIPRYYDGTNEPVMVAPFDRFFLSEETITVVTQELVQASPEGHDRLRYPAVSVYDIMDATGKRWGGNDCRIVDGQIVWNPGGGPGIDPVIQKGVVYSIRYTYRPFFYVDRMLNEVRVAQVDTDEGRIVMRMPQSLILQREYVFEKEENDERAPNPDSPRQVKEARKFGAR